jgi:hypothetical protein
MADFHPGKYEAEFRDICRLPKTEVKIPWIGPKPEEGQQPCFCGKKLIDNAEVDYHLSGLVRASDNVCRECLQDRKEYALIVCVGCKKVATRMKPHRDATGFVFEPRKIYHVAKCFQCVDGLVLSKIIEKELYDGERRRLK